jgi:hypothetical protein
MILACIFHTRFEPSTRCTLGRRGPLRAGTNGGAVGDTAPYPVCEMSGLDGFQAFPPKLT